ncbi:MAG: ABC transporter permease [Pseudomonadales bacterium]
MSKILTVLKKECIDNFRDRRTIISSFALAALGPLGFVLLMTFVLDSALGKSDEPLELTVMGAAYAPSLVSFLERKNTTLTFTELEDADQSVRDGDETLILRIPADFGERFDAGQAIALDLIYDSSDIGPARRQFNRARGMINEHARTLGQLRLALRGISPVVVAPFGVQEVDVSSPAARALTILSTVPYLLIVVVFMGGFYLAIDTTAGERENKSLEPLLAQPVSRRELVLGKMGATSVFGVLVLILFLFVFTVAVPLVPFHKVGMRLDFGATDALQVFVICLPLVMLAAALLTVVASFAKSYKEAQTYLSLLIFIPTMPIIITQFLDLELQWWLMLIPSQSQATLSSLVLAGEPVPALYLAISALTTVLLAALLAWVAIRLYSKERILG